MKHTDEWVGGETDLETVQKKLFIFEQELENAKNDLNKAVDDDEIIDIQFTIKKLEIESIPQIKTKIINLKNQKKLQQEKNEKNKNKEILFKKLYVEID